MMLNNAMLIAELGINSANRWVYSGASMVAMIAAVWLIRGRQSESSLLPIQKFGLAVGGIVGATFAAKLPFLVGGVMDHGLIGTWLADGKTILWGLVGGYVGVEVAKWALLVKVRTGDSFIVPVAVAIAIGRLGCFGYGCCYGVETDQSWGVRSALAPDHGTLLRHPAQIYEFLFHAAAALIASFAIARGKLKTHWMLIYLIGYSLFRFVSEWWRDEPVMAWGLTFYQWSAFVIASMLIGVLVTRIRSADGAD